MIKVKESPRDEIKLTGPSSIFTTLKENEIVYSINPLKENSNLKWMRKTKHLLVLDHILFQLWKPMKTFSFPFQQISSDTRDPVSHIFKIFVIYSIIIQMLEKKLKRISGDLQISHGIADLA